MGEVAKRTSEHWEQLVDEQSRSGQTIVAFCAERRIAESNFHYHKRRIREGGESGGFRQLKIRQGSGVRLVLESGKWQVAVDRGFDGRCLKQVLEVLG
jgi:hypothetical protein